MARRTARVLPTMEVEEPWAYDATLSFAGEDRDFVERVAAGLRDRGIRVFYDRYETVDLWGKDLIEHLQYVYRDAARYCVLFISAAYARKAWPTHERRSAYERALTEHGEYVLPARFDDTEVPGLRGTIGYVDLRGIDPEGLVEMIHKKLGPRPHKNYLPPVPDLLYRALGADDEQEQETIYDHAWRFVDSVRKTTPDERLVINTLLLEGCPGELPDNVHMSLNVLKRETGFSKPKLMKILERITPLGFDVRLRDGHAHEAVEGEALHDQEKMVVLEWHDLSADVVESNATLVAETMLRLAVEDYCNDCAEVRLWNLDFSQLATVTAEADHHGESVTTS